MNPDGTGTVDVADVSGFDVEPDYARDGTKIVFRNGRAGAAEIYTVNADGTGLTQLTCDSFPAWSPDGSTIAFRSYRADPNFATCIQTGTCNEDIFVMPATGGSPQQLTFAAGNTGDSQFSPDGRFLAYESDLSGALAVNKVDVTTRAVTKLTEDSVQAGQPDWSPDGTEIAFVNSFSCSSKQGKDCKSDIFVINADGGSVTQLTRSLGNNLKPTWSPQGDKLVFTHGNNLEFNRQQIHEMHRAATAITRITRNNDYNTTPERGSG
jgi:Tol biopolymer transport system component